MKNPFRITNTTTGQFVKDGRKHVRFATRTEAEQNATARGPGYSVDGPADRFFIMTTRKADGSPAHLLTADPRYPGTGTMRPISFRTRAEAKAVVAEQTNKAFSYKIIQAPVGFRSCEWCFDDGSIFFGFTNDTLWNGFLNIWVVPAIRDLIVREILDVDVDHEYAAELTAQKLDKNGLCSLAYGCSTSEIAY